MTSRVTIKADQLDTSKKLNIRLVRQADGTDAENARTAGSTFSEGSANTTVEQTTLETQGQEVAFSIYDDLTLQVEEVDRGG